MRWYGRATFALSTLSVATCIWGSPTISDFEANAYYLTVLRTGLALERDRTGTFPEYLREICPSLDGAKCQWFPFGYRLEDAWGRAFHYRRDGDEYELRSGGKDGRPGTADDIVFRPSMERGVVDQAVGCYRVRGAAADSVDGLLLRLDRDSIRLGRYRAQPPLPRYSDPGWQWIGHDSITVDWPEIHHALTLRLRVRGDSLVGRSSVGPGAASWYGTRHAPQRVVATRVRCNANPS